MAPYNVMSEEDKILVKQLRLQRRPDGSRWGAKRILKEFPDKNWKLETIKRLIRKVDATGDCKRIKGSGRPRSARSEENIEAVDELIQSQENEPGTHLTPREISRQIGISSCSVRNIIKKDLHLNVYKRTRVNVLTERHQIQRKACCKRLLERFSVLKVARIWFGDEKNFTLRAPVNSQNNRVYSRSKKKRDVPSKNVLAPKDRYDKKVMVFGYVSKIAKGKLIFVEEGAKLDGAYYREILKKHLQFIRKKSGKGCYTFQQDGAKSHTANATIQYIEASVPDYIEKENWPPKSSDLNPLDYSIWGILEQNVYYHRDGYDTIDELKGAIQDAWKSLPKTIIDKAINQWRGRLQMVVDQQGGHIDHLL